VLVSRGLGVVALQPTVLALDQRESGSVVLIVPCGLAGGV
jgi:hypothetical protein